jgi:acetylornithine deacetylase/succinyl-diaminopimelate desuccinylase-like protein
LPSHSGMGGAVPDAAIALNHILARLYWHHGPIPVPGLYDNVRILTDKERKAFEELPFDDAKLRQEIGVVAGAKLPLEPNCTVYEATWRKPSITVIAQEASSLKGASNQILPRASAIVSSRIVPDQDPDAVYKSICDCLTADPPWGVEVNVSPHGLVKWWMVDPNGPAFEAALAAMESGYKRKPVAVGCGGSIGFIGPLSELFGGAPCLLLGIEDPASNAHAPNESLHEGDFKKLMASLCHLFENLSKLAPDKVK